jgi:type I restriction enzyme S subunit
MFGDPAKNPKRFPRVELSTLARSNDNINYGVIQPGDDLEEGVPLIRVGDIVGGSIRVDGIKHISPEIEKQYRRSRLIGDEILVSCVGSIGAIALADLSVIGYNIARAVARIPPSDSVNRQYLAAYLRTEHVQRYFVGELRTVSQPTLNIKQLSETMVVLPPLPLQEAFSHRVEAIEVLKIACQSSLAKMDALFTSLQHKAFKGEL